MVRTPLIQVGNAYYVEENDASFSFPSNRYFMRQYREPFGITCR